MIEKEDIKKLFKLSVYALKKRLRDYNFWLLKANKHLRQLTLHEENPEEYAKLVKKLKGRIEADQYYADILSEVIKRKK